jgi:hypothetical protein
MDHKIKTPTEFNVCLDLNSLKSLSQWSFADRILRNYDMVLTFQPNILSFTANNETIRSTKIPVFLYIQLNRVAAFSLTLLARNLHPPSSLPRTSSP